MKTIRKRSYEDVPACERCGRREAVVPILFTIGKEDSAILEDEDDRGKYILTERINVQLVESWCHVCADSMFARCEEPISRKRSDKSPEASKKTSQHD